MVRCMGEQDVAEFSHHYFNKKPCDSGLFLFDCLLILVLLYSGCFLSQSSRQVLSAPAQSIAATPTSQKLRERKDELDAPEPVQEFVIEPMRREPAIQSVTAVAQYSFL